MVCVLEFVYVYRTCKCMLLCWLMFKERQIDRWTDRQTDRRTDRQAERERQGDQEVERQSNRLGRAWGHFIFSLIIGLKRILFTNTFQRL